MQIEACQYSITIVGPKKFYCTVITLVGPKFVPILQLFDLTFLGPKDINSIAITIVGPSYTKSNVNTEIGPKHRVCIMITLVRSCQKN